MATAQTVAINGVTPSLLWVALFVVIGVCAALITVLTMIEKIRALKAANDKPQE